MIISAFVERVNKHYELHTSFHMQDIFAWKPLVLFLIWTFYTCWYIVGLPKHEDRTIHKLWQRLTWIYCRKFCRTFIFSFAVEVVMEGKNDGNYFSIEPLELCMQRNTFLALYTLTSVWKLYPCCSLNFFQGADKDNLFNNGELPSLVIISFILITLMLDFTLQGEIIC